MTHTIISKRTSPFVYTNWVKVNGQFFREKIGGRDGRGIVINGGAGIVGGDQLLSGIPLERRQTLIPESVLTFVDDEVLAYLERNPKFKKDVERGIITVVKGRITQSKGDQIAAGDMIPGEHIPTRPVTVKNMEAAGAVITKDGSVDISDVGEETSPMKIRQQEAGLPAYEKRARREARRIARAERKAAKNR